MTQLNIKYVNPAKEGKRYGTIKTQEGQTYMLPVGMTDAFQPGTTVEVPVKQETWGKDAEAKVVHIINGRPAGSMAQVPNAATLPAAAPQAAPPPQQPTASTHGFVRPTGTCNKDVLITATALMKSFIETGNFGLTDLPALEAVCIPAAKRIVGASQ